MNYEAIRRQIVEYAQKLYHDRLVSCTSGNISVRIPSQPQLMAITPGSEDYLTMTPERIVITTLDGECSPRLRMHAEIAHSAARILLPPELAANANKTPVLQAMGE